MHEKYVIPYRIWLEDSLALAHSNFIQISSPREEAVAMLVEGNCQAAVCKRRFEIKGGNMGETDT
jgi:hypothetical protein